MKLHAGARGVILPLLFSVCVFTLPALDLFVNGTPRTTITYDGIADLLYLVPVGGSLVHGISADELLPLFVSAYRVEISGSGSRIMEGDDLADRFSRWYLVPRGAEFDLEGDGWRIAGVKTIRVYGEVAQAADVEVWVSWEGVALLKREIARFAELHGIRIKATEVPKTDSKLLSVLRGGGTPPDVIMVQSDYIPDLVAARAIQNVDYLLPETITSKGLFSFRAGGKVWAVPFYFDSQLLFYNPALVREPIPSSWSLSDMERIAERISRTEIVPMSWNVYSAYWLVPFQVSFGKSPFMEADGRVVIDDQPTGDALRYLLRLKSLGYLAEMERDAMIAEFVSGNVAMILSGSYSIPEFSELGIPFAVAPYPMNDMTGLPVSPLLDFKALAIPRKTKNPVLARRLIQYLCGIGVQQRFTSEMAKLPADERAWDIVKERNPYYPVLRRSADTGTPIPPERGYAVFKGTMWKLLRFVLEGQLTVEETLRQGQTVIDAGIGR